MHFYGKTIRGSRITRYKAINHFKSILRNKKKLKETKMRAMILQNILYIDIKRDYVTYQK